MNPALEIAARIRARQVTAVEVARQALARAEALNPKVNAFTALLPERAMAEAAAVDARIARGEALGPLAGVPYAMKNLFDLAGLTTLAGSKVLRGTPPAARDGFLVRLLAEAGAVCLGALNMDEFAYGFTTENSHYGPTRNPHDLTRIAGGSSGGSVAAVAAGLVPLSLGTDTNGSIRVPASLNGLFGVKPTYSRLSRHGSFPFVYSLDHVGAVCPQRGRPGRLLRRLAGAGCRGPATSAARTGAGLGRAARRLGRAARGPAGRLVRQAAPDAARHAVAAVAAALGGAGEVTWAMADACRASAFTITSSEGAALHLPTLRTRLEEYEPLIVDRLLAGAMLPAAWVNHAQRVRALAAAQMREVMADWDVLIAPATPVPATPIGQEMLELDGETLPLRASMGLFTQPVSGIGLPVVTVPVQRAAGVLPIGVQLIGKPWTEALLFRTAAALEAAGVCAAPVAPAFAAGAV